MDMVNNIINTLKMSYLFKMIKLILGEYGIYIILVIAFLVIRCSPYSINAFVDDVVNDIALGGASSVFVACMIKINDDSSRAKRRRNLFKRLIFPLMKDVAEYMDEIVKFLHENSIINETDTYTFARWNEYLKKVNVQLNSFNMSGIEQKMRKLHNDARELVDHQGWYLLENVVNVKTIEEIKKLTIGFSPNQYLILFAAKDYLATYNSKFINQMSEMRYFNLLTQIEYGYDSKISDRLNEDLMNKEI